MNKIAIAFLVLIINSCIKKEDKLLIGGWERVDVKAKIIQSWLDKSSCIHHSNDKILKSTNPIIESNSFIYFDSNNKYKIGRGGKIVEKGKWRQYQDTLKLVNENNEIKRYIFDILSNDTLVLFLNNREKVESINGIGILNGIEIKLAKRDLSEID